MRSVCGSPADALRLVFAGVQIAPKGDLVLVEVAKAETKTTGGVLLPSSAQKKPTSGGHACSALYSCLLAAGGGVHTESTEPCNAPLFCEWHSNDAAARMSHCMHSAMDWGAERLPESGSRLAQPLMGSDCFSKVQETTYLRATAVHALR